MSEEAVEAQLVLPSERTAAPMETAPTKKVYQSTPMFDDPMSSASEDESKVGRATFRGGVVTVPLQNSMRLPEAPTSVTTISRTANTSMASTSKAGLVQVTMPCNTIGAVDGSRSQHRARKSKGRKKRKG